MTSMLDTNFLLLKMEQLLLPKIYHYSAFSTVPGKGNPAGIVFEAEGLTKAQMQEIARQVGFNETAFLCQSTTADLCLRYFYAWS
jgi:trans-2,3-dihydro-3-hydroxyanthranilate isomerase